MGSGSAVASLERVLKDHRQELVEEMNEMVPREIRHMFHDAKLEVADSCYDLEVTWQIRTAFDTNLVVSLRGPMIGIDSLAERFPCCEVGY